MNDFLLFLHVIGAVGMGFYIVLPALIGRASRLAGTGQQGLADGLASGNRLAQYFLVLQFLTGGYLISQKDYTVLWMVLIIVLFLAIAAVAGIMTKPIKRISSSIESGQSASADIRKAQTMSVIVLVLYLVILYLMKYPMFKDIA
ncbi:hypothetical protein IDH44_05660 [Paenibacillus sp. IB182496]|uniref:DUF2269 family protein n=1 Tax=Paenibacillus sabuli TaxID=2772509 RepID=A0A927GQS0_9BACL|nr:hypothetical protein [Paenibacillus sabuli]MBD2844668.1 hypothetical protein [Paenibacillus sabuli]